ncbi:hypothetical protein Tco_1332847 [Tanacetum coccineum]
MVQSCLILSVCSKTLFYSLDSYQRFKLMGIQILKASHDVKKAVELWNFPLRLRNWRRDVSLELLMELLKSAILLSLWKIDVAISLERPCTLFLA